MTILISILEQGLIYGILALGVYLTYQILNFPDLTVDGSFPLGAAVCAWAIVQGVSPFFALPLCFAAGALAGAVTGVLHVKFGIRDLLAGIIVMTGLYTVNLTIVGKPNLALFQSPTIFTSALARHLPESVRVAALLLPIVFVCKFGLDLYLNTKSGFLLKASGDNPMLVITMAKDPGKSRILGLSLANGLVALAGGVLCQQQRFFEISIGTGSMVMGLATVVIGLKLLSRLRFLKPTTKVLLGSLVYKAIVAAAIAMGLSANSMKLITAILFFVVLVLSHSTEGGLRRA